MKESPNSSHDIDVEIVEPATNSNGAGVTTATFNQQNNYHLAQNIDLDKLTLLADKSPELSGV
jgi:hypothetical protein